MFRFDHDKRNKYVALAFGDHAMPHLTEEQNSPRALMLAAIPRLRRFAMALTGSAHDGDDLVQITLERGLTNLDRWQPGTKMESWLMRIAYNAWIDETRSRKRRGPHLDFEDVGEPVGDDGRAVVHSRLDLAAVREAMAELSEEYRAVIALVGIDDMSYQEAADTLKIPIGTVMSRLSRARKALTEKLDHGGARSND
jgi:RNA polymerase sigma-70 factor, ECF subfamily